MTQAQPTPAGWNPDPFGRFQWRYWDGSQWTDQVSSDGAQSTDAPSGEIVPPDRSVFEAPTLVVVYAGNEQSTVWPVYAGDQPVASVAVNDKFIGYDEYFVSDTGGRPLLQVRASGSALNPDYAILDPAAVTLGVVDPPEGTFGRKSFDIVSGERQILARAQVSTTSTSITGGTVTDASGREVARLSQGQEKISFLKSRAWLTFERDPALADPLPALLVGWLLALYDYLNRHSRSGGTGTSGHRRRRYSPL